MRQFVLQILHQTPCFDRKFLDIIGKVFYSGRVIQKIGKNTMTRQELEGEIKELIAASLDLEDVSASDIVTDAPLFGDGLGLDSIDALELGMAIKKQYGVTFSADKEANKAYFKSVATLAEYIANSKGMKLE